MQPNYQPNLRYMDSYSGIIIEESRRSEQFSDFTPIPCKGFNILCKAKRYGRWWVLKGLKEPYRQDENYKNLLHKEFDILISLLHPNIVSAYSMEEIPEMGTCIVMEWIDGITLEHWSSKKTEGEGIFRQQTGYAAPLTGSQNPLQPTATEPSSASHLQSAELISKGKKTIDKMWKESGIDTIRSVVKKSEAYFLFVNQSNEFITTTYPQTFSKDIDGKKADIIYELSSYTTERYVKPTLSSFQSSK